MNKPRILLFTKFYKPGFKGGGPIKSTFNIVESLKEEFRFDIVTLDRDLGDIYPYNNIKQNQWNQIDKDIRVFYYSPNKENLATLFNLKRDNTYQIIYLNSLFGKMSRMIILLKKMNLVKEHILIAPRGEVEKGALKLKTRKKMLFLRISALFKMYKNIFFHATNEQERNDINKFITCKEILISSNILDKPLLEKKHIKKKVGEMHAIFISRISPKKNILLSLRGLQTVKGKVVYDIYGPIEDQSYYNNCKEFVRNLPDNITVNFKGELRPDEIKDILPKYHFFIFPTLGENFGHVIYESLNSLVPVITTTNVPANKLKERNLGVNLGFDEEEWTNALQYYVNLNQGQYDLYIKGLKENVKQLMNERSTSIENTKIMFNSLLNYIELKGSKL